MRNPAPTVDALAAAVTGRADSLFAPDVARHREAVAAAIQGRRVLAIGGAGSIGGACIRELLRFSPAQLVLVDHDENALVETVRDLRSGDLPPHCELRTAPLDFGAPVMRQFLGELAVPDVVLHFAANKHVRAERDRCSLLQMLDTNVLKTRRLCRWLAARGFAGRFFAVSSDKAANPTNLLGASKRLMERCVFAPDALPPAVVTSARFANVAFSNGSLLHGFLHRIANGQPLAAPRQAHRWFVTPRESGQLCLLAAAIAPARHIVIPRLPQRALVALTDVADLVVRAHGRTPTHHVDEASARATAARDIAAGRHPVLHTPLDTGGEKVVEEFVGRGEAAIDIGCSALAAIADRGTSADDVHVFLDELEAELQRDRPRLDLPALARRVGDLLPEFAHAASDRHLDQRM